ncbi:hypothetical protein ACHABX_05505 [Nesterenkonia halotolerans]|uniref:hypothetical protein n=1 Tax=Nesterenkonia halotolerans TaxID=225325 RepID=UPI003EE5B71E
MTPDLPTTLGLAGMVMAVGLFVIGCSPAPAPAPGADTDDGEFRDLGGVETNVEVESEAELEAFIRSDAPKTIYLDEAGDFSRVEEGHQGPDVGSSEISGCELHDLCLPDR